MKMLRLFKRWMDMIAGKSVFHVKQGVGRFYSKNEIKGYYNDLTGKVSAMTKLDCCGIPITTTIAGVKAYFPIAIFQYGLGLYDLYLETADENFLKKFLTIADWAVNNICDNGMWDCMDTLHDTKHLTQSSMCQSEGVSILLRAYIKTNNEDYIISAKHAIEFMVKDLKNGGTCMYENNSVVFQEYITRNSENLAVLNGWIFSVFGLYDYVIFSNDEKYKQLLNDTIDTLAQNLKKYDRKFWSNYDQKKTIASPAYHDLHIMQLELLYELFHKEEFKFYSIKWKKNQNNKVFKIIAMLIKLKQKIFKKRYYDINTSTI